MWAYYKDFHEDFHLRHIVFIQQIVQFDYIYTDVQNSCSEIVIISANVFMTLT